MPAILIKCAHRRKPAASAFRGHSVNGQTSDSNFWPVNFAKCSATAELYVTAVRIRYGLRPRIIVRTRGEQLKEEQHRNFGWKLCLLCQLTSQLCQPKTRADSFNNAALPCFINYTSCLGKYFSLKLISPMWPRRQLSPGFVQRPPSNYPSHGVHFSQDDGATIYSDTYS
ncbi:uncharacterized protein LOC128259665 isoform X1 [Drosophila gunungcola]|uniref:uncharacterized protein LOC128259665 isoform X1 n=1 Tax=Drosophila gunungcola TaxID=103775 RepID=UPI0022E39C41|nr:uncharacterized protein LOC128259665 isoform X1 [Drosophila gunungcola]